MVTSLSASIRQRATHKMPCCDYAISGVSRTIKIDLRSANYVLDRDHWTEGFGPIGGNAGIKIHAGRKSMPPAVPKGRNRR